MKALIVILVMLILGSAQASNEKNTLFGQKIVYIPIALLCFLMVVEVLEFRTYPTLSLILFPVVLLMMWITSKSERN
jgi:hypothetical protein